MNVIAAIEVTNIIMFVFRIIVIALGMYVVYSAVLMKRTGIPGKWLVEEQELTKCKDQAGFALAIAGKTLFLGVTAVIFGMLSVLNQFIWISKILDIVSVILFVTVCGYFFMELNRTKGSFFE